MLFSSTLFSTVPFNARGSSENRNGLSNSSSVTSLIGESQSQNEKSEVRDERSDTSDSKEGQPSVNKQEKKVNHSPRANAGPDVTVSENQEVSLNAERSNDVDGDKLSYLWSRVSPVSSFLNSAASITS